MVHSAQLFLPTINIFQLQIKLDGTVSVFNIATQQATAGSPYFTGGQTLSTFSLAYTPAGDYLAAANTNDGSIYPFSVQADGSLIEQQIITQPAGFH